LGIIVKNSGYPRRDDEKQDEQQSSVEEGEGLAFFEAGFYPVGKTGAYILADKGA
jgi:hypothetical protein